MYHSRLKLLLFFSLMIVLNGCTSFGSHRSSIESRSNTLSAGLQKTYSVNTTTANRISPIIIQSSDRHDVPATLLSAVIRQESNFKSLARSPTGAVGLGQIIPSYWSKACPGNLYDEHVNINCSAHVLATYYNQSGNWKKALGYYNVGPSGYENSFWTRRKAKKYINSVKQHEKQLKRNF